MTRPKVLESDHPTEFGKTSKKEKNSAVIFGETILSRTTERTRSLGNKARFLEHIWTFHLSSSSSRKQELQVLQEISFLVPMKYIDVVRRTNTYHWKAHFPIPSKKIDVVKRKTLNWTYCRKSQIDYCWNANGDRQLSIPWTSFTQFTQLNATPPKGYMWSGEILTKIQAMSTLENRWPEV